MIIQRLLFYKQHVIKLFLLFFLITKIKGICVIMNSERLRPFFDKLKSKSNLIMVILGLVFLIDLYYGSPVVKQIILFQLKIMDIDPSKGGFTLFSIFGKFYNVDSLARVLDKALFIGFFILSGASYMRGLIGSIINS